MAFTQLLPEGNRSGSGTTPGLAIPAGTERVTFRLFSSNWPVSNTTMTFALERSDDNGANWREVASGVVAEGARNRDGSIYQTSLYVGDAVAGCQIRATYRFTSGSMRFGVEYELTNAAGEPLP